MEQSKQYLFWFVAIQHTAVEQYIIDLEKYIDPSGAYLISKETAKGVHKETGGQHIHVAAEMDITTYNKFHDNIHKKKLKLLCKAKDGIGKQVGRTKDVRDQTKFLAYTCKDQNIIYKNIDLKTIQLYISESYPKTETWEEQIINYFKLHYVEPDGWDFMAQGFDIEQLETLVIKFYIENSKTKAVPTRGYVKKLILRFLMYEQPQIHSSFFYQIKNLI